MRVLVVAAGLCICGAATARDLEPPTREPLTSQGIFFRPSEGRFSVFFPAEPAVSDATRRTFLGRIVERRYAVEIGDTRLAVELYDLPRVATFLLPASAILGRARERLVEGAGGRVVSERDASHGSFPAREVAYELSGPPVRVERALLVLVGRRLYLALATWPGASAPPSAAERLFETLEVWPP